MLEAVLENDDETPTRRNRSTSLREEREKPESDGMVNGINLDDRQAVLKGILPIYFYPVPIYIVQSPSLYFAI